MGAYANSALRDFPNISLFVHISLQDRGSTPHDGLEKGDVVVGPLNNSVTKSGCCSILRVSGQLNFRTEHSFTFPELERVLSSMKFRHDFYSSQLKGAVQRLAEKVKLTKPKLQAYTMLQSIDENATRSDNSCAIHGTAQSVARSQLSPHKLRIHHGTTTQKTHYMEGSTLRHILNTEVHDTTSSYTNPGRLVTEIPCLAIRGTYINEHPQETDEWLLRYAQVTTASYAKQLTFGLPGPSHQQARLKSLKFDEADLRLATIKFRWRNTCAWVLQSSTYRTWLSVTTKYCFTPSLLWIRGNPGSGKSTLTKFILANLRQEQIGTSIVNFFFNARGVELEKCATGMYRSILYQLLLAFPMLHSVLEAPWMSPLVIYDSNAWDIESLQSVLRDLVTKLESQSIIWLVDALDECNEEEVRDMIDFLESLVDEARQRSVSLRILFSSRHYPQITANSIDMVIEAESGHKVDISSYIQAQLRIPG